MCTLSLSHTHTNTHPRTFGKRFGEGTISLFKQTVIAIESIFIILRPIPGLHVQKSKPNFQNTSLPNPSPCPHTHIHTCTHISWGNFQHCQAHRTLGVGYSGGRLSTGKYRHKIDRHHDGIFSCKEFAYIWWIGIVADYSILACAKNYWQIADIRRVRILNILIFYKHMADRLRRRIPSCIMLLTNCWHPWL